MDNQKFGILKANPVRTKNYEDIILFTERALELRRLWIDDDSYKDNHTIDFL